jgi:hypothetical protein
LWPPPPLAAGRRGRRRSDINFDTSLFSQCRDKAAEAGEIQLLTARGAFMTAALDRGSVVAVKGKWTTSWDIPEWFYR